MVQDVDLFGYHWFLTKNKIMLSFDGILSQEILINLAEMIKQKVNSENNMEMFAKKVFGIFVELAQNIQKYSIEMETLENKKIGNGSIVALDLEDCYTITSCNKIYSEDKERIAKYCDKINGMNKDQLKTLYKETLKLSEAEHRESGGVGLIEIVRKSGNPIEYRVVPIDNGESYLILSTKINKNVGDANG